MTHDRVIKFRASAALTRRIQREAERTGHTVSSWIRRQLAAATPPYKQPPRTP